MFLYYPMALPHGPFTTTPLDADAQTKSEMYQAMVRYIDHCVGRLVDALDELRLRERTIIIFTTDNGSERGFTARMAGREVRGGKATLGESGMCAPFIVNGPTIVPRGVVTDALIDFTDLFPTFVELAGATMPDDVVIDGRSFAPLILGSASDSPRDWIMSMGFGPARLTERGVVPKVPFANRVVRDKRFKLWILDGKPAKLYDLKADPAEVHDVIASTAPEVVTARKKLVAALATFPATDAAPRYHPAPPQPWDRKVE